MKKIYIVNACETWEPSHNNIQLITFSLSDVIEYIEGTKEIGKANKIKMTFEVTVLNPETLETEILELDEE